MLHPMQRYIPETGTSEPGLYELFQCALSAFAFVNLDVSIYQDMILISFSWTELIE
ncbi:hypothetical protein VCRA2113O324_270037 [Vibrio crassostreae]|nr:hypothetical protein VCRA2113O324_270037 [Vibrio crassostreae]CAK1969811.1 hypothetical protein VCRA2111O320_280026 [Vibrio crassostreae]CAK2065865.1 hypothetical protein VCRA2118O144_390016 [Vibrio crassostreae]CAK2122566.1 hypothetical protein VCRA2119O145_490002 [Vibrio crassostreae]CAK2829237.1 hypothetical protein VCRA2121O336_270037 [Vibrio crassostreae]